MARTLVVLDVDGYKERFENVKEHAAEIEKAGETGTILGFTVVVFVRMYIFDISLISVRAI